MAIFCGKHCSYSRYAELHGADFARYAELHGADFARNAELGYLEIMIQG